MLSMPLMKTLSDIFLGSMMNDVAAILQDFHERSQMKH